ncbi:hypothetical protein Pcinc_018013 [Petrolisthes cinctipes]|uniref:G-protein coupled receptors family 1 profile domain-containing protein n=1 Tax=Petrolisthes cinctipes TaxID=88211 RepID=A0AAE1FN14_PETCI|nr:hypothetical protein Pcinc_018013 [Petrolisthes cinctipes]
MSSSAGLGLDLNEIVQQEKAPRWALILTATLAILIAVLGFFGNLLTILALPYARSLRTNQATFLVINLAVAEGIFCITILPLSAAHLVNLSDRGSSLFTSQACNVFVYLRYVNIQAELLSIAAIAINRCILIAVPKKYPTIFTTKKTLLLIATIWTLSIVVMLVPLLGAYGSFTYNEETDECDFDDSGRFGNAPRKVFLALGSILPCIVVIVSYSYIYYKARQSSAKMRERCQDSQSSSQGSRAMTPSRGLRSRDIRIARTIGVIFIAFIIQNHTLLLLLHPLYWLQYCINVFIYVFMNQQYRDAYVNYIARWWPDFRELSRRRFRWKEEQVSENTSARKSRAGTPSSNVRFNVNATRKLSMSPSLKDTRL